MTVATTSISDAHIQQVIDDVTLSPIYTTAAEAETKLLDYEIVRLTASLITLPSGSPKQHIRLYFVGSGSLVVKFGTDIICTSIPRELVSFIWKDGEWVVIPGY
jgi:hypothetical protein